MGLLIIIPAILYDSRYTLLNNLFSNNYLMLIGKLSYSLYLFHWFSMKVCEFYGVKGSWQWYAGNVLISGIMTSLSYRYVEKPVLALRKKYGSIL